MDPWIIGRIAYICLFWASNQNYFGTCSKERFSEQIFLVNFSYFTITEIQTTKNVFFFFLIFYARQLSVLFLASKFFVLPIALTET